MSVEIETFERREPFLARAHGFLHADEVAHSLPLGAILDADAPGAGAGRFAVWSDSGGVAGVWAAHLMFEETLFQIAATARTGPAQWFAEAVATFGLIFTILATLKSRAEAVPMAVGLYITAAYWFTASTSFANPAVTIARSLSDTFAGIDPAHMPGFVLAQLTGAGAAFLVCRWLLRG